MMLSIRTSTWLLGGALAVVVAGVGCSSSNDAEQTPAAGKAGAGAAGTGSGGRGGATSGGTGGTAGSGGPCVPIDDGASGEAGASGASGESGAGGASGEGTKTRAGDGNSCLTKAELPWLHVEGNALKDPNGNTVILRGVAMVDLGATEVWEGGVTNMIDRLTKVDDPQGNSPTWGTRVVRLMVGPKDGESQTPIQYEPDGDYYERVLRPAVDYARKKGLYAIIDWHYIDSTSLHVDTTTEFWADIAPRFAGDSHVLFELYNEPINGGLWPSTRLDMQAWYDTVREGAPDNLVLVGTPNWCQMVGEAAQFPLDGTNVVYVAHMYPQHWQEPFLRQQISDAAALVPVFMTEWGFRDTEDELLGGTITSYGDPIKAFMEEQRISWTAWAASATWGPPMFDTDYTLRVGEGEMGGFVKDWLYEKRNDDLPQP